MEWRGYDRYLWIDRYWRGPAWLSSTWFIIRGLMRRGYAKEGTHLADQTLALIGSRDSGNTTTH